MNRTSVSVAVVGAGVVGTSTAYALARDGYDVTLIDTQRQVGRGSSAGNGGQLTWGGCEPLGNPGLFSRLPNLIFGRDKSIAFNGRRELGFYIWCLKLLLNSNRSASLKNTKALQVLAESSEQELDKLMKDTSVGFGYRLSGKLQGISRSVNLSQLSESIAHKSLLGCDYRLVGWDEALEIEPGLSGYNGNYQAAIHAPRCAVGDAQEYCETLAKYLVEQSGVRLRLGQEVTGFEYRQGRISGVRFLGGEAMPADVVVLTTASVVGALSTYAHDLQHIVPIRGFSLSVPAALAPINTSFTDAQRAISFSKVRDYFRVTGFFDMPSGIDPDIRLAELRAIAQAAFPAIAEGFKSAEGWTGVRAMTPTSLPIITRSRRWPGLYFNVGHGMLGWTLALGSARSVVDLIGEA